MRCAISRSASSSVAPDSSSFRISADASSHCWRSRPCSNRSAFCTAIPAAAASASTTTSSSAVNSPPPFFSVRYRLPNTASPHPDRHPEESCASAGGSAGSRPTRRALLRSASRSGRSTDDQLAEQTLALRERPHPRPGLLVQPDVDEPGDAPDRARARRAPRTGRRRGPPRPARCAATSSPARGPRRPRAPRRAGPASGPASRRSRRAAPAPRAAARRAAARTARSASKWRRPVASAVRHARVPCASPLVRCCPRRASQPWHGPPDRDNRPAADGRGSRPDRPGTFGRSRRRRGRGIVDPGPARPASDRPRPMDVSR